MKVQNNILTLILILFLIGCDSDEDRKGRFLLKGNEKLEENDPKSALGFYQEALDIDSTYADAWFNKAVAHLQLNQLEEAIADFSQAIRYKNNYVDAYFQRGLSYLDNGEFYKARTDAEWMTTNNSDNWQGFFLSGFRSISQPGYDLLLPR